VKEKTRINGAEFIKTRTGLKAGDAVTHKWRIVMQDDGSGEHIVHLGTGKLLAANNNNGDLMLV
jgi:hypothetical protein